MSSKKKTDSRFVTASSNRIAGGVNDNDSYLDDSEGGMRYRYSIPMWAGSLFALMTFLLAAGCLAAIVLHHRADKDAYECNSDDKDRWFCPAIFEEDDEECALLPYNDWADGGEFNTCFFGICVYFKEWSPVPSWPCFTDGDIPIGGVSHCLDFISDSYPKKDRLRITVFCNDGSATCVFSDLCAQYDASVEDLSIASHSKVSKSGTVTIPALNGTNFYLYGSRKAAEKNAKRASNS
jgi:hypothetical protein